MMKCDKDDIVFSHPVITVTDDNGKFSVRIFCNCNNDHDKVHALIERLREKLNEDVSLLVIRDTAASIGVGCEKCLVIYGKDHNVFVNNMYFNTDVG